MIFKSKFSKDAMFRIAEKKYRCIDGIIETEDKEVIEFLSNNVNFDKEVKSEIKVETVKPKAKKIKKAE